MSKLRADSLGWLGHFRWNAGHRMYVSWEDDYELTEGERQAISRSIQAFQLGEGSEGKGFVGRADDWGQRVGDPGYGEAVRLFIAEENEHAGWLGRFMDGQAIPRVRYRWTDAVFRRLRGLAGLEVCVRVLVAAELVAKVYYKALREATLSPVLRQICTQILRDEGYHVRFQCGAVRRAHAGRPRLLRWAIDLAYRAFVVGTILVVWVEHRRVFRAGRYTFVRFVGEMLCELEDGLCMMSGQEAWVRMRADEELTDQLLMRGHG